MVKKTPENLTSASLVMLLVRHLLAVILFFWQNVFFIGVLLIDTRDPMYRQFMRLAVPAMIAAALFQLNALLDVTFVG